MNLNNPSKRAFTLIELLVVVTIIVVLLAMLVPALDKAIGYAEEARCLSNLHAIGIGLRMYTMDYRGYFPPKYMPGTTTGGEAVFGQGDPRKTNAVSIYWWVGTAGTTNPDPTTPSPRFDLHGANDRYLNPYVGIPAGTAPTAAVLVAQCPADNGTVRAYTEVGTSYASNHSFTMSSLMAYNKAYVDKANSDPTSNQNYYSAIKVTRVQSPSRLVAGGDVPGVLAGYNLGKKPAWHRTGQDQKASDGTPLFTFGLGFVDGHAAMETYPWGQAIGNEFGDYTFDEYGRESRP